MKDLESVVDEAVLRDAREVGLAIAVVSREQTRLCKAYGNRIHAVNGETAEPVALDTPFALGSLTKPFTSFLLAQAAENGLVDALFALNFLGDGLQDAFDPKAEY